MTVGQRLHYVQWVKCGHSWQSETGENYHEIENPDMGLFKIDTSPKSSNSSSKNRGIIPGIIYRLTA